jgi:glycosyltransferase involved in cell wall biosynthesis
LSDAPVTSLRILHVLRHVRRTGNGITNHTVDLACEQAAAGHTIVVASAGGEFEEVLARHGIPHHRVEDKRGPLAVVRRVAAFRRLLRNFRPDIVHAHTTTPLIVAVLARPFGSSWHLVATVHNEFQRSAIAMGLADRVIAISDAVRRSLQRRGIPARKLAVVRNGTLGSVRSMPPASIAPAPLQRPAIATVAGMYHRKGIAELIEAFVIVAAEFPAVHLYVVGDGPDRSTFENGAGRSAFASRIHFEGFVPEPQRYYASTDVFVLASHREPFGLVILEAREAGCAVIGSDVDGIPEALDGGRAGILVRPRDRDALAQAMRELLGEPKRLEAWRRAARVDLERWTVARMQRETEAIYFELCRGQTAGTIRTLEA